MVVLKLDSGWERGSSGRSVCECERDAWIGPVAADELDLVKAIETSAVKPVLARDEVREAMSKHDREEATNASRGALTTNVTSNILHK